MAVAIRMPDLGTVVEEVKLLKWRLAEGDNVKRGDALADVETDKAVTELESIVEGVLLKQVVPEGAIVTAGTIVAYVGKPGETVVELEPDTAAEVAAAPPPVAESPRAPQRVSPLVTNLARKLNVNLLDIKGTGAGGMITRDDVLAAANPAAGVPSTATAAPVGSTVGVVEELTRSQIAVARAVLKSIQEVPHLRIVASIDMTVAQKLRKRMEVAHSPVSYDAIFLKAMAGAMKVMPLMAARLDGQRLIHPQRINIAMAVGFGNDLFLPVVRDVDNKDLLAIQADINDLVSQAKAGSFKAAAMTDASMSLSNLGIYPIESFEAIIFPGQSSVLAVGSVREKPVIVEGQLEIRPLVTVDLSADHRYINGRTAAQFVTKVKEIIESGQFA